MPRGETQGGGEAPQCNIAVGHRLGRGGRPSRADALHLRQRILEAATELFLAEGYGSTTIEAVAERAGISKRTLSDKTVSLFLNGCRGWGA